jgi:predicted RNA polymerase sigma factor
MAAGPAAGLALLDGIVARGELDGYHLLPVARAELLVRSHEPEQAALAFKQAIQLCTNPSERAHLEQRLLKVVS